MNGVVSIGVLSISNVIRSPAVKLTYWLKSLSEGVKVTLRELPLMLSTIVKVTPNGGIPLIEPLIMALPLLNEESALEGK